MQALSEIRVKDINFLDNLVQIKIPSSNKISGQNRLRPIINKPSLADSLKLCVAGSVKTYLKRTETIKEGAKKLFITHKKPYHEASSQSISRWIQDTRAVQTQKFLSPIAPSMQLPQYVNIIQLLLVVESTLK